MFVNEGGGEGEGLLDLSLIRLYQLDRKTKALLGPVPQLLAYTHTHTHFLRSLFSLHLCSKPGPPAGGPGCATAPDPSKAG